MNLRNYDKLKEITNLTRHRIPLDFKDFISSKWLFFSSQNVALPHNVFHQQRTKKNYLPLRKGIYKWGVTLISVASSLRALLASRDTVQLIPTPLHELLLPDLQLLRIRQFLSKHIFKDLYLFYLFFFTVPDIALWHPFHWLLTDWYELYSGLTRKIILHTGAECCNSQSWELAPRHT